MDQKHLIEFRPCIEKLRKYEMEANAFIKMLRHDYNYEYYERYMVNKLHLQDINSLHLFENSECLPIGLRVTFDEQGKVIDYRFIREIALLKEKDFFFPEKSTSLKKQFTDLEWDLRRLQLRLKSMMKSVDTLFSLLTPLMLMPSSVSIFCSNSKAANSDDSTHQIKLEYK